MLLARSPWLAALLVLASCAAPTVEEQAAPAASVHAIDEAPVVAAPPDAITPAMPGLSVSVHTTLGIPEAASANDPAHALLVKSQYVVSFDSTKQNPRWTSWEVTKKWIGDSGRSSSWVLDTTLPAGMKQASNADYTSSGFQRGHLCPSADRTITVADNKATFVFTNAVPQTQQSNIGPWADAERTERSLADAGRHVFVIAGSLHEGEHRTIGDDVWVPSSMWKVIVVMDGASPKPTEVTAQTRVISIEVPNTTTATGSYKSYKTTLADLETKTGMTFLSDVDPAVHDALATATDPN